MVGIVWRITVENGLEAPNMAEDVIIEGTLECRCNGDHVHSTLAPCYILEEGPPRRGSQRETINLAGIEAVYRAQGLLSA